MENKLEKGDRVRVFNTNGRGEVVEEGFAVLVEPYLGDQDFWVVAFEDGSGTYERHVSVENLVSKHLVSRDKGEAWRPKFPICGCCQAKRTDACSRCVKGSEFKQGAFVESPGCCGGC